MAGGITLGFLKFVLGFDSLAFQEGATNAQKELKRMEREFRRSADSVSQFGQRMSLSVTAPLVAIAALGVREAQATQQAMAQVNAALASMGPVAGRSAEQLTRFADQLELSSLFEADTILKDVTANLLTFGNVAGTNFDRAQQAVVDLSTRMGTDLQAATVQVGRALNDPIKGMTALGRAGIQFSDAQKAAIRQMVATNNIAGAQNIILGELERQFGGAAAAAQATDPFNKATDAFKQMAEQIGTALLPVLPRVADAVVAITSAFTSLSPGMQTAVIGLAAVGAAVGPVAIGLGAIMTALAPARAAFVGAATGLATIGPAGAAATAGIATTTATATAATGRVAALGVASATAGRAMLAAFGGPIGIAVAALATGLAVLSARQSEQSEASAETTRRLSALRDAAASVESPTTVLGNTIAIARRQMEAASAAARQLAREIYGLNALEDRNRAAARVAAAARNTAQAYNTDLRSPFARTMGVQRGATRADRENRGRFEAIEASARADLELIDNDMERRLSEYNARVGALQVPQIGGGGGGDSGSASRGGGGRGRGESDAAREATQAAQEQAGSLAALRQQYLPVTAAAEELARKTNVLKIAFREGDVTGAQFTAMLAGLRNTAAESTGRIIDWGEFIEPMEQIRLDIPTTEQALSGLSDHFEQQADRMQRAAERQRQAFDTMLSSIQNLAYSLQKGDVAGIISGVLQTLQSFGNMKEGGFNIGGLQFGGARAAGGPVSAGKGYVVGEKGPEWFEPGRSGRIISNDNFRRGGGAGRFSFSIEPTEMFRVVMRDEAGSVVAQAAPAIMQGGAAMAQSDMARRSKYAIPG